MVVKDLNWGLLVGETPYLGPIGKLFNGYPAQPEGAASELTPLQPLGAVATAMNMMPGATMVGESAFGN
jgi:hypothetical protein